MLKQQARQRLPNRRNAPTFDARRADRWFAADISPILDGRIAEGFFALAKSRIALDAERE